MSRIFLLLTFFLLTGCSNWSPPQEPNNLKNLRVKWESTDCNPTTFLGKLVHSQNPKCVLDVGTGSLPTGMKYVGIDDDVTYISSVERVKGNPDSIVFDIWYLYDDNPNEPQWSVTRKGEDLSLKVLCHQNKVEVYRDMGNGGFELESSLDDSPDKDLHKKNELIGQWMCSNY